MEIRYDVIPVDGGWVLTDSRGAPRAFLSESAALSVALALAGGAGQGVEVHLWRNGTSTIVYPLQQTSNFSR